MFPSDPAFRFQALRALSDVPAGGADTGEVLATLRAVRAGDGESWFQAWTATADRLIAHAEATEDRLSRGLACLRAHTYLRTAEFFLPPADGRRLPTFDRGVAVFERGLALAGIVHERFTVPFDGQPALQALHYPAAGGSPDLPLLLVCGGYDSTLEELYFVVVQAALARGYSVLTFEGPGQGAALRHHGLHLVPDWERPTSAVLDHFLAAHAAPASIVSIGMSLAGYLAPRAAAFEPRIRGVVAYDVLLDFGAVARHNLPIGVPWLARHGHDGLLEAWVGGLSRWSTGLRWSMDNGRWVLGTRTVAETLAAAAGHRVESALVNARSVTTHVYDAASGGAEHCQVGASYRWHADLFSWLGRFSQP